MDRNFQSKSLRFKLTERRYRAISDDSVRLSWLLNTRDYGHVTARSITSSAALILDYQEYFPYEQEYADSWIVPGSIEGQSSKNFATGFGEYDLQTGLAHGDFKSKRRHELVPASLTSFNPFSTLSNFPREINSNMGRFPALGEEEEDASRLYNLCAFEVMKRERGSLYEMMQREMASSHAKIKDDCEAKGDAVPEYIYCCLRGNIRMNKIEIRIKLPGEEIQLYSRPIIDFDDLDRPRLSSFKLALLIEEVTNKYRLLRLPPIRSLCLYAVACLPFLFWCIKHGWPNDHQRMSACQWPYNIAIPVIVLWGVCWMFGMNENSSQDFDSLDCSFLFGYGDFGVSPALWTNENLDMDLMENGVMLLGNGLNNLMTTSPNYVDTLDNGFNVNINTFLDFETGTMLASEAQNPNLPIGGFSDQDAGPSQRASEGFPGLESIGSDSIESHSILPSTSPQSQHQAEALTSIPESSNTLQASRFRSKPVYRCSTHNFKTQNYKLYGKHMWEEDKIKVFACEKCDYRTARQDNLPAHRRTCKGRRKKSEKALDADENRQAKRKRVSILDLRDPGSSSSSTENQPNTLVSTSTEPEELITEMQQGPDDPQTISITESSAPLIPAGSDQEDISELMARIKALEQENSRLKQENLSIKAAAPLVQSLQNRVKELEEDLEQARSDEDVWRQECKRLRKDNKKRPREE